MVWKEPLNLEYWFVNLLSGNPEIFVFLAFIAIASMAAYFRMLNTTTLMMFALFSVVMSAYIGGFYLIVILLTGLVVSYYVSRIVTR